MKNKKMSLVALAATLGISLILLTVPRSLQPEKVASPTLDEQRVEKEKQLSDSEKRKLRSNFYETALKPLVENIINERWDCPVVNERHHALTTVITNRYKQPFIDVEIALEYGKTAKEAGIMALVYIADNGAPTIRIYVPNAIRFYNKLADSGDPLWYTKFSYGIAKGFIHELDHLELGLFPSNPGIDLKDREFLEIEAKAHGRTCERLLRPLIEQYQIPICEEDKRLYSEWVRSGRKEASPIWFETIRKLHE